MRGNGGDRFAYDPAEKPPRGVPPVAQPVRFASSPRQFASAPQAPPPPPLPPTAYAQQHYQHYQQQLQQQQQQMQMHAAHAFHQQQSSGERFADADAHGSQRSLPPTQQQQQSYQYYPPDYYVPHHQQQQQQQQQQQPLLAQQYSGQASYPPLPPNGASFRAVLRAKPQRVARSSVLPQMLRLLGFHVLNAVLGLAAFSLLGSGVSSSVSLLPLCCLGVVVFRVVLYGVHVAAQLDVMLLNFASAPREKVELEVPLEPGRAGLVLAPSLEAFSPLALLALLYFLSVKAGVALLSAASALLTLAPLALLVAVACGVQNVNLVFGGSRFSYAADAPAFVVASVCFTAIGCALMVLAAKASAKATKFFCCESFSTLAAPMGYQQHARQQQQQLSDPRTYVYAPSASYGSA